MKNKDMIAASPVPKGCKRYWFSRDGYLLEGIALQMKVPVFSCIAINDASAIRKFKKWKGRA